VGPRDRTTAAALHVTEADPAPRGCRHAPCRITGVLLFDDHPQREVRTTLRAPTAKWPRPGDQLPVTVRLSALDTVTVAWRRLPPRDRLDATTAQTTESAEFLYRVDVLGDPGRPLPGSPGGGATPWEAWALIHRGEPATAVVLAVTDVRAPWLLRRLVPAPPGGVADLILQVTRADHSSYQARMRIGFSSRERRDRVATVGAEVPVRIQADKPDRVAVDTAALEWS
jgi:hypothetical protein